MRNISTRCCFEYKKKNKRTEYITICGVILQYCLIEIEWKIVVVIFFYTNVQIEWISYCSGEEVSHVV